MAYTVSAARLARPASTAWIDTMKSSLSAVLERTGAYFMKRSPIHEAARRISTTLAEMGIPFAVAGALAANVHGHVSPPRMWTS